MTHKTITTHPSLEGFLAYIQNDPIALIWATLILAVGASSVIASLLSNRKGR